MRKPTICIGENKDADELRGNREADQRLCFRYTWIVHLLFFLNPKFQASSLFLLLHRPVCVGPVRKTHCWFSHETAHIYCIGYAEVVAGYTLKKFMMLVYFLDKAKLARLIEHNPCLFCKDSEIKVIHHV